MQQHITIRHWEHMLMCVADTNESRPVAFTRLWRDGARIVYTMDNSGRRCDRWRWIRLRRCRVLEDESRHASQSARVRSRG